MKSLITSLLAIIAASARIFALTPDSISATDPVGEIRISAAAGASYIFPTNNFLRGNHNNTAMITPEVRAGFTFSRNTRYGRLYGGVTQGIGLNLNAILPHSTLGNPAGIFVFQTVPLHRAGALTLEAGWDFGVSTPWKHFDHQGHSDNSAIGSTTNALLGVSFGAVFRLNSRMALKAGLTAIHYSNGNTHLPNAGVNTAGMRLGFIYTVGRRNDGADSPAAPLPGDFIGGIGYDVTVYGATRGRVVRDSAGDGIIAPGSFGVAGLNFAPMYAFSRYIRAGVSVDMQYDESANLDRNLVDGTFGDEVLFYRQPFSERFSAGLSLRGELTLPIFSIGAGIGRNLIARGNNRAFYQMLVLKAYIYRGTFLQAGYRLHDFHEPSNLMLGVGYTFGRR